MRGHDRVRGEIGPHEARARWLFALPFILLGGAGCGPAAQEPPPWTVETALGSYDDGSGRQGIAVLQTVRDGAGGGAAASWAVTMRHESGASFSFTYDAPGAGSHEAVWRFDTAPLAGHWDVEAVSGGEVVRASAELGSGLGLAPPVVGLSPDGAAIQWPEVAGATSYLCRVYGAGSLQLETWLATPGCDLSALPPGGYSASIVALSADPTALLFDASSAPSLPARFDVAEARLGFTRAEGSAPARTLRAVGGAYDNGVGPRSFAVWLELMSADGAPVSTDWQVEIVGPGLPADNPLTVTYWAGLPRLMAWAVGVNAAVGKYTATATSGGEVAVAELTVGAPAWLPMPTGVVATDGAQGSARVSWDAAAGAVSYLASAWDALSGEWIASQWTPATSTDFPAGTFTAGRSYDVFVAVSDVDMLGGTIPTQVSVAENVFDYSTFVAR